jgi:lambda repressor-like predicted transcriptional regulator
MHPEQIKAHMRMNGTSPSRLADLMAKSRMAVSNVIHGRMTSRAIAKRIAKVVGRPVAELWPGRYDEAAPKKKRRGK